MIMSTVYADILSRAGEGYSNYTTRAREIFWRAIATIMRSGEFTQDEAKGMYMKFSMVIPLMSFPFDIEDIATGYEVFNLQVKLSPNSPNTAIYTQLSPADYPGHARKTALLAMTDIPEVLWTYEQPNLKVAFDANNSLLTQGNCLVEALIHGVHPYVMTSTYDTIDSDTYMAYSLLIRAIEMSVTLLIQELRG